MPSTFYFIDTWGRSKMKATNDAEAIIEAREIVARFKERPTVSKPLRVVKQSSEVFLTFEDS